MILIGFSQHFWRFWSFLGDIGPFLRPDLGEKLGGCYPLQVYINHRFFKPRRRFRTEKCWRIAKTKLVLCREAIEESTFARHFWELCSSVFSVVSFVGFLRSGRTIPDHFCNLLALLWCTFKSLNRNKKASPTETKARRRRRDCQTSLSLLLL